MTRPQANKFWTVGTLTAIIATCPVVLAGIGKAQATVNEAAKVPKLEEAIQEIRLNMQEIRTDLKWLKKQKEHEQ